MVTAIYQGTFDPITNGHLDIARRTAGLFDRLILAVFDTPEKTVLFSTEERLAMTRRAVQSLPNVEVEAYRGLTVEFAREMGVAAMIRGLRSISDFDNEFAMNMMNRKLHPEISTVFLITSEEYAFVSSSLSKEVAQYGGNIDDLVPENVAVALREKFRIPVS